MEAIKVSKSVRRKANEQMEHRVSGRKTILYDTYVTTLLSKPTESTPPRVSANVNCSLSCRASFTQQNYFEKHQCCMYQFYILSFQN